MKQTDIRERIQLMTDPAYQGAYYDSPHDESQCWEPCGELGKSMEHAVVAPNDLISQTLISKLASIVEYCELSRRKLLSVGADRTLDMLLDDPEVAAWVHQHRNDKLYSMRMPR